MPSKKSKSKTISKIIDPVGEEKTKPITAKIVLFLFGVGPLIIICLFLLVNGFFSSP